ncbi:MAG: twin-arginine translocase TatA/TatE family subunit [Acidobacteriaceae bacterium]|jgi:sec-independent protein translocase protein TatB
MPGFEDSAVIVLLALLLFGPKKLPVLARQLGKLMGDFRRASNEFRSQMEEELRISEQADRQKQIAAIEATAQPTPAIAAPAESAPEGSYMQEPPARPSIASAAESTTDYPQNYPADSPAEASPAAAAEPAPAPAPTPIATSGDLSIMPPTTGLPIPNSAPASAPDAVPAQVSELETETLHG